MTRMTWQVTPWVVSDLLAAGVMVSVGILAWRRRSMPGATPFGILALAVAVWAIANAFYFSCTDMTLRLFWNRIKFLGIDAVALAWLAFVLAYAGQSVRLTRLGWGVIGMVPLISTMLHWAHDYDLSLHPNAPLNPPDVSFSIHSVYDAWYPLHLISTYLLIGVGVLILCGALADRSSRLFRGQLVALLVGVIVPWLGDVPIALGLLPPEFETTPLVLAVSALAFAYALLRFQLFDVVPAAYASVIANMADGLIVLDGQGRIVELNRAAAGALGCQPARAFGRPLTEIQPDWPVADDEPFGPTCSLQELVLGGTGNRRHFELHQSPVVNQRSQPPAMGGQPTGMVIVMRDITERVQAEEALRRHTAQLEVLGRVALEISAQLDRDCLLQFIVSQAMQLMNGMSCGLALYRPEHDALEYVAVDGPTSPPVGALRRPGDGLIGKIWETGQPVVVNDYQNWPGRSARKTDPPVDSALGVPVRWGRESLGTLTITAWPPRRYSPADADLLSLFAAHAAIAIRNVGLMQSLRDSEKQLQDAEQRTQESLREKEMLLKEIHHRVKNNLQIVSSLLYLQAELVDDERARHLLEESQNRVKSLAMIHEQLYQSPDLARVDFTRYVRNLASYLFDAHMIDPEEINLVVNVANVALEVDVAMPCSLIINELLSNALKHAFPGGTAVGGRRPEIRIVLHPVDGHCRLVVSDNGVGLPADMEQCSTASLGLQIVDVLTRQLKGTLEVERQEGTAFKITFPWLQGPKTAAQSPSE